MAERESEMRQAMINANIAQGLGEEDAVRAVERVAMRLGGATHEETLAAYPRIEPRRDRDGKVR